MFDSASVLLAAAIAAASIAALALAAAAPSPDAHPALLRSQALVAPTRNPRESPVVRSRLTPLGAPLHSALLGHRSSYSAFAASLARLGPSNFVAARAPNNGPFVWLSYERIDAWASSIGAGLVHLAHLRPISSNPGPAATNAKEPIPLNLVGIFLKNSVEWLVADYAAIFYGLVSVPIHDSFDALSLAYILNHSQLPILVIGSANLNKLIDILPSCKFLKFIVIADSPSVPEIATDAASNLSVKLVSFADVDALGKLHPIDRVPPNPLDIMTISYTSGTTGNPKGVLIRHESLMAGGAGIINTLPKHLLDISEKDRHLSYLPMSHMLERIIIHNLAALGVKIGFFRGDINLLFDDINELKPTLFFTVPRLLIRLHDRILATVANSSFIAKFIFNTAFAAKKRLLHQGIVSRNTFWDFLVFRKIQARAGGCITGFITGAAPIDPNILQFIRIVFGVNVLEGYGQTESSATGLITTVGDYLAPYGSFVGVPFTSSEYKLVDVPSMDYYATDTDPRGEICLRGPTVMSGYYKDPARTSETIDNDHWLHTGDVGQLLPNGTLKIIDRIKNIFKLSQGEFVAPERIEQKIKSAYLQQVYVHGDSIQSSLVLIGIVDPDTLLPWARSNGLGDVSITALCRHPRILRLVLDDIVRLGKLANLAGYEIPRAVYLDTVPMSVENGLLTPTFKTKRFEARKVYAKEIERMYGDIGGVRKS